VLKWLREQGIEWDCDAAQSGHLEILKWALVHGCAWDQENDCGGVAREGQLEVLKWAREQDLPCLVGWDVVETCAAAAEGGHFEVLRWLRELDPPCRGTKEFVILPSNGATSSCRSGL